VKENIVEFPDRSAVQEEAALWLIRLDGDTEPSEETLTDLRAWIARSPVHRDELRSLAATWSRMNVLTELSVPLGRVDTRKENVPVRGMLETLGRFVPRRSVLATMLAVAGSAASYSLWKSWADLASNGSYATRVGEQRPVVLADGSVALLNTNSEIRVEYGQSFRDIRLIRGEVEFTVAKNPAMPFRVYVGNERVQALGTAFTVYMQDKKVDVIVTEGRVALATLSQPRVETAPAVNLALGGTGVDAPAADPSPNAYVETLSTLQAGQSATMTTSVDATNQLSAIESIENFEKQDMARRLSWRDGLLIFAGDPLEDVVREISRYTTMVIEIRDPQVREIKIGGQFPVGETDAMLDVLEANFRLRVTRLSPDRVLLSAAEN
jgi:transmembrane sensor